MAAPTSSKTEEQASRTRYPVGIVLRDVYLRDSRHQALVLSPAVEGLRQRVRKHFEAVLHTEEMAKALQMAHACACAFGPFLSAEVRKLNKQNAQAELEYFYAGISSDWVLLPAFIASIQAHRPLIAQGLNIYLSRWCNLPGPRDPHALLLRLVLCIVRESSRSPGQRKQSGYVPPARPNGSGTRDISAQGPALGPAHAWPALPWTAADVELRGMRIRRARAFIEDVAAYFDDTKKGTIALAGFRALAGVQEYLAGGDILERDSLFRTRVRTYFAPWPTLQERFETDCAACEMSVKS